MSKLIYAASKAGLQALIDKSAEDKLKVDKALAFTEDGYFYTHGKYFKIPVHGASNFDTPTYSNSTVTITDYAGDSFSFDRGIHKITTSGSISGTTVNGAIAITHATKPGLPTTVQGAANSGGQITVPLVTVDTMGHVSVLSSYQTKVDQVKTTLVTDNVDYLVTLGSINNATEEASKSTKLTFNPSSGLLSATKFSGTLDKTLTVSLNGLTTDPYKFNNSADRTITFYAPASAGTKNDVLRSNGSGSPIWEALATSITAGNTTGIPSVAAVYAAVSSGISANDAMRFMGVIDASTNTTYPAGRVGDTYKISVAGTMSDGRKVEAGDTIIATVVLPATETIANKPENWTILQTNIESSVVGLQLMTIANAPANNNFIRVNAGVADYRTVAQTKEDLGIAGDITTALGNFTGTSKITTVGTIGTGTWRGTAVAVGYGGTGVKTLPSNSVLIGNGTSAITNVSNNGTTTKQFLSQTSNGLPVWSGIATADLATKNLTTAGSGNITLSITGGTNAVLADTKITAGWTGTLGVTSGGTGLSAIPINSMLYADAANSLKALAPGTNGYILKSVSGVPTWSTEIQDTHHTSKLVVTGLAGGLVNAASVNGATRLNIIENGDVRSTNLIVGGANTSVISDAAGKISISSVNTWRNVKAYNLSGTFGQVLSETPGSLSTADLQFGKEFVWAAAENSEGTGDMELKLGWAEVSSTGIVTYVV